jgi:YidC/Oxa1 family membrane protein insertase
MTDNKKQTNFFFRFAIIFLLATLILQFYTYKKSQDAEKANPSQTPLTIETTKDSYAIGKFIDLKLVNHTDKEIKLEHKCPESPVILLNSAVDPAKEIEISSPLNCAKVTDKSIDKTIVPAKGKLVLKLKYWHDDKLLNTGRYQFALELKVGGEKEMLRIVSNEFSVEKRGFFSTLWYNSLVKPFYNLLILMITITPGHSLGLGIIFLTILVRLILLVPSNQAMRSQKQMTEIQPRLEALRDKYKNDQQKLAMETMKVWKEANVNPLGSCLPLLIQLPILIALFYVISGGVDATTKINLYNFFANFDYDSLDTILLSILPLTERNVLVLPLIVGLLQFVQMQMTFKKPTTNPATKNAQPGMPDFAVAQNMMKYILPAMIAVFTASVPAGVGLYWGVSTLFAIGQQFVINRSKKEISDAQVIDAEVVK